MRAAIEFDMGVVVVPVVVVYTDKSRYRSRVRCYFFWLSLVSYLLAR